MSKVPILKDAQIEKICRLIEDHASHSEIGDIMRSVGLKDVATGSKFSRLRGTFLNQQQQDGAASGLLDFVRKLFDPVRFVEDSEKFEEVRQQLNLLFAFSGLRYDKDGEFRFAKVAETIDEAHQRADTLKAKFKGRRIHPEVEKYCEPELLQENYFHAVFEASKGLAERIRNKSGIEADGAALVDKVFSADRPVLAFNSLRTDTEISEHKGFASLLKGCFAAVRNPRAHHPKILWKGEEDDTADYLSLISLLHRKLDDCVKTGL